MKKFLTILSIITVLLVLNLTVSAKQITTSPLNINIEYTIGASQPSSQTISITNNDNDTFTLTFNKEGDATPFFNITPGTGFYTNVSGTSKDIVINFGIAQTTNAGLYTGKITYGSGTNENIPVFINVKKTTETVGGCRISVPFSAHIKTIQRGTQTFSNIYNFQIPSVCDKGVDLTSVQVSGAISTTRGEQPIRISAVPTKFYEPGEAGTYTIEFDVSELPEGTYTTFVFMSGTHGDDTLTKTIKYDVTVVGKLSPITNNTFSTLPSCTIGTNNLVANQSYEFRCVGVNPNLAIAVSPNEFLKGLRVDTGTDTYSWIFQPTRLGKTELKTSFIYKNSPIGETLIIPLEISTSPVFQASTEMFIDFLNDINTLKDGDNLSFLIKDAVSQNLITDADIYLNGIQQVSNLVTVTSGVSYRLSVAKPGYNTAEANFTVVKPMIQLSLKPDFELKEIVTVGDLSPADVTWTLNGVDIDGVETNNLVVSMPISEMKKGDYYLTASKSGYESVSKNFSVLDLTTIISDIPEKISKDEQVSLQLSRNVEWLVQRQNPNATIVDIASSTSELITFTPIEAGIHSLYVRNKLYRQWEVKKGFGIGLPDISTTWWYIIAAIIIGVAIWYYRTRMQGEDETEESGGIDMEFTGEN